MEGETVDKGGTAVYICVPIRKDVFPTLVQKLFETVGESFVKWCQSSVKGWTGTLGL